MASTAASTVAVGIGSSGSAPGTRNFVLQPVHFGFDAYDLTIEARDALHDFIRECHALRLGCVRVIHGKGLGSGQKGPVLKAGVDGWLRRWDEVAAFCSAQPKHGGTGAAYVLLTKKK